VINFSVLATSVRYLMQTNKPSYSGLAVKEEEFFHESQKHTVKVLNLSVEGAMYEVYYLNKPVQLIRYWKKLVQSLETEKVVAVDSERDIVTSPNYPYPLARIRVLSICSASVCLVIGFSGLSEGFGVSTKHPSDTQKRYVLFDKLAELLQKSSITKVGISLEEEELYLKGTFVQQDGSPVEMKCLYDLQVRHSIKTKNYDKVSLQQLCLDYFSVNLSKDEKVTKWGVNELTDQQIVYSALDSIYCYLLKDLM